MYFFGPTFIVTYLSSISPLDLFGGRLIHASRFQIQVPTALSTPVIRLFVMYKNLTI